MENPPIINKEETPPPKGTGQEVSRSAPINSNDLNNAFRGIDPVTGAVDQMSANVWLRENGFR